jgi:ketosteroid isomerase-like protein
MPDRSEVDRLIRDLHTARVRGDLAAMCGAFAEQGRFQIAGSSEGKPVSIAANGIKEFRPWLSMMVKAFRVTDYQLLSLVIEGNRGAAHWRARIDSKITGVSVPTELVDLVESRSGKIVEYTEFFVPK